MWSELFKDYRIEDLDNIGIGIPVGVLMSVLVGSPWYEGIVGALDEVLPTKLSFEAQLENPGALLYALRVAFPNLRIYENKDLKIDGSGMKAKLGDIESF